MVLLCGDPGLGKSRLIEEANAIWSELEPGDDRRWDFWRCVPYDTMQPYAQYRRLIRERAGVEETDDAETVRTKIAALMEAIALEGWEARSERVARALLGVELPDEPPLEGEEFQREATELVVGSTVAQGGRRLIVFEDLHWCDHASLDLVRATIELVVDAPIVVRDLVPSRARGRLVGVRGSGSRPSSRSTRSCSTWSRSRRGRATS